MNIAEAAREMKIAGRRILLFSIGFWIVLALFSLATAVHLIALAIAPGTILWLLGSILERLTKTTS